jgi:hypothetical protein
MSMKDVVKVSLQSRSMFSATGGSMLELVPVSSVDGDLEQKLSDDSISLRPASERPPAVGLQASFDCSLLRSLLDLKLGPSSS